MVENNTNNIIKEDDFQYEKVKGNQLSRMWHSFKKRKVAVLGLVIVIFYGKALKSLFCFISFRLCVFGAHPAAHTGG